MGMNGFRAPRPPRKPRPVCNELTLTFDQVMAMPQQRWRLRYECRGGCANVARYGSIESVMLWCREYSWRSRLEIRVYVEGDWTMGEPERLVAIFDPGGEVTTADGVHYYYYRIGKWCRKVNRR